MTIRRSKRPTDTARVRRDPPARTTPIRAWPESLRSPDSWNAGERLVTASANQNQRASHSVDGIKLGYEVIEQHIRHAATVRQRRRPHKSTKPIGHRQSEIQDTIARVFRSLSELMPLMAELVNSPAAAGVAQNLLFNNPLVQTSNHASSGDAAGRVTIELSSPRPATVTIELHAEAEHRGLAITGLHDRRGRKLALDAITFTPAKGRRRACLRLRLPDGLAPGVYSGVLLDRSTSEPRGVLTVRLAR
jgi:hypothetical protein